MLKTVYDPEIPVNVYDLGLIYRIELSDDLTQLGFHCSHLFARKFILYFA